MEIDKFISHQIEYQFPAIYREDGEELVSFVKSYYEFLESDTSGYYVTGVQNAIGTDVKYISNKFQTNSQATAYVNQLDSTYSDLKITKTTNNSIYHNRRLFEYRDIDSTLQQMLIFFKKKFLNDLPFNDANIRFIVKHILDMYRRKGTKEGLQLFFKLFYSENVEINYPALDILKPSSSIWKIGRYLELHPVDPISLSGIERISIYGSISGATAVVDRVNFVIVSNTIIPIAFLSNVRGTFITSDEITGNGILYGKVRGSLSGLSISNDDIYEGTANNHIGDLVEITGTTGAGGKGRISKVTKNVSGEIDFEINNGGFGYSLANTDIIISNQTVFTSNPGFEFKQLERVKQTSTGAMGTVIGQNSISVGILLNSSNSFSISSNILTVDRSVNLSMPINYVTVRKVSNQASAKVGSLTNTEQVSIIVDRIGNFLNVPLNSNNYSAAPALVPMSGTAPITINTVLDAAFVANNFIIGTIASLSAIDPGADYLNDVFIIARENVISNFNLANQIIEFDILTGVSLNVGDIVTQYNPKGIANNRDIKGIISSKEGNIIDVMQISYTEFSTANTFYLSGSSTSIDILSISKNYNKPSMGLNADIFGRSYSSVGKIEQVDIVDSGIGFITGERVNIRNLSANTGNVSGVGTSITETQGISEGVWENTTSHLNSNKKIQDSFYYQDFSYEIESKLNPENYINTLEQISHVAGTKAFHKFKLIESINIKIGAKLEFKQI